jgi:hypothetical protein
MAAADTDVIGSDIALNRHQIEILLNLLPLDPVNPPSVSDVVNALVLAQDALLPNAIPQAQPIASVAPTGSPFTWTAPFDGLLSVTSGTVSQIDIIRTGVTTGTGLTIGLIPLSRADQAKITYTGAPVLHFLPR